MNDRIQSLATPGLSVTPIDKREIGRRRMLGLSTIAVTNVATGGLLSAHDAKSKVTVDIGSLAVEGLFRKWTIKNASIAIDGLTLPALTASWVGVQLAAGVLAGVAGAIFDAIIHALFGGPSIAELLAKQLKAIDQIVDQRITENELRRASAFFDALVKIMVEYQNAPSADRLSFATNQSTLLSSELETLSGKYETGSAINSYLTYLSAASLRIAVLQQRANTNRKESKNIGLACEQAMAFQEHWVADAKRALDPFLIAGMQMGGKVDRLERMKPWGYLPMLKKADAVSAFFGPNEKLKRKIAEAERTVSSLGPQGFFEFLRVEKDMRTKQVSRPVFGAPPEKLPKVSFEKFRENHYLDFGRDLLKAGGHLPAGASDADVRHILNNPTLATGPIGQSAYTVCQKHYEMDPPTIASVDWDSLRRKLLQEPEVAGKKASAEWGELHKLIQAGKWK